MSARSTIDQGRHALVTGASSGFGLLASIELARAGLRVFAGVRDPARQGALVDAARAAGVSVEVLPLDVTRAEAVDAAAAATDPLAVLVNNAGVGLGGFAEDVGDDELRRIFETNFFGAVALTKAVLPAMRAQGRGRIINITSINGRFAPPGLSAYAATKFALEGWSESLYWELLPHGIQVVLVEPGTFKTDIFTRNRALARRSQDPASPNFGAGKRLEEYVNRVVARSTAEPVEVARVIARAATATRPRLRYLVGGDAKLVAWAKHWLPERLFAALVWRELGSILRG
jgi:NAD(P)-dependent dehydrogenase (short-subunit alcohol dehydrogenase family)